MKLLRGAAIGAIFLLLIVAAWAVYPAAGVPILCYHKIGDVEELYSVSPVEFEKQMRYLAEHGYTAVSMADLVGHLTAGKPLPPKPVVITFDDGYADNYRTALPIMEKYGLKATVFMITDFAGQGPYMSWDEIREMSRRGTEIGSHTLAHRALTDLPLSERLRDARASKEAIEWQLEKHALFLAYPFGQYDADTVIALKEAGYKGACGTHIGLNRPGDNVFALKRIGISRSSWGMADFHLRWLRANIYTKLGL